MPQIKTMSILLQAVTLGATTERVKKKLDKKNISGREKR